jgi:predicted nucleic acid-binding protein
VIVVDTNLIVYLFLTSDRTSQAENALRKDPFWAVPRLWRSEFRNVLVLYLRKKLIRLDEAQHIMEGAIRLVSGREYEVASFQVLSLAAASNCSAYDCEFVALAKDLNVPLVTVDKQILAQFPDSAISLEKFISG